MSRRIRLWLCRLLGHAWNYYRNPYRTDVRQCRRCQRVSYL